MIVLNLDKMEKYQILLDKFGNGRCIFQSNWGKLTTIGFVTLNSDEIINSMKILVKNSLKTVR